MAQLNWCPDPLLYAVNVVLIIFIGIMNSAIQCYNYYIM